MFKIIFSLISRTFNARKLFHNSFPIAKVYTNELSRKFSIPRVYVKYLATFGPLERFLS